MDEWKVRQEIYHKLTHQHSDTLSEVEVDYTDIAQQTLDNFSIPIDKLIFPAKTYTVAIVYADLLHRAFGVDIIDSLNDPTLLFNTSPFFKTYDQARLVYDQCLHVIATDYLLDPPSQIVATIEYFHEEFMLYSHPTTWKHPIPTK